MAKPSGNPGGRGGKRKGAGAPKGPQSASNKQAKKIAAERIAAGKKMPLEVMIEAMEDVYAKQGAMFAFDYAAACAPYLHPKRQPVDDKGASNVTVKVLNFAFDDA